MIRNFIIGSFCMILIATQLTGSAMTGMALTGGTVIYNDDCDGWISASKAPTLKDYVAEINYYIRQNVTHFSSELTPDQMETSVATFQNLQAKLSGTLMCEIDGVKYKYPNFVLEREDEGHVVTEVTRYFIRPLDTDANGVYLGVKVTAHEDESGDKIREMNAKLRQFECSYRTESQIQDVHARFQSFKSKYDGILLCYDSHVSHKYEVWTPTYDEHVSDINNNTDWYYNYMDENPFHKAARGQDVRWCVKVSDKENRHGLLKGIIYYAVKFPEAGSTSTGDLMKSMNGSGGDSDDGSSGGTAGSYMLPDVPVKIK